MKKSGDLDDDLAPWESTEWTDRSNLLLGNGFSRNIWSKFGYASLFETAKSGEVVPCLSPEDLRLFECLKTENFEDVLSSISTAVRVVKALGQDASYLSARYESIKQALVSTVHSVHIAWNHFPEANRDRVATILAKFGTVYSTNYDLLTYWCVMSEPKLFKDYFWSKVFDIKDTKIRGKGTVILYLHGGFHLVCRHTGQTLKRVSDSEENLLDQFGEPFADALPLFVSEGTAAEKLASIYRSEYLRFALAEFSTDSAPLVVFGHSLADIDQHLIEAMNKIPNRRIAIGIKPDGGSIRQRKAQLTAILPKAKLTFFNAETHPLGSAELTVNLPPK